MVQVAGNAYDPGGYTLPPWIKRIEGGVQVFGGADGRSGQGAGEYWCQRGSSAVPEYILSRRSSTVCPRGLWLSDQARRLLIQGFSVCCRSSTITRTVWPRSSWLLIRSSHLPWIISGIGHVIGPKLLQHIIPFLGCIWAATALAGNRCPCARPHPRAILLYRALAGLR